jgi:hypothetical protein
LKGTSPSKFASLSGLAERGEKTDAKQQLEYELKYVREKWEYK